MIYRIKKQFKINHNPCVLHCAAKLRAQLLKKFILNSLVIMSIILTSWLNASNILANYNNSDKISAKDDDTFEKFWSNKENKVFSQNGEDGILETIFANIGMTNKYYVEFGVQNGLECNTRYLKEKFGFNGLLMDAKYSNTSINLHKEFITAANINELFKKYQVPYEFDLLSIDIDRNDWYVWRAIDSIYKPRVIVIEYNSIFKSNEDKIVKYDPLAYWDFTNYFGASAYSMYKLGKSKGYTLVYANRFIKNPGVNLFFIRSDLKPEHFFPDCGNISKIVVHHHHHPFDFKNREYLNSEQANSLFSAASLLPDLVKLD